MIYLISNIILDYLEKTVHNLFTITTNVQVGVTSVKEVLRILNKIEKYLRRSQRGAKGSEAVFQISAKRCVFVGALK